jgi:hypothetical protein
MAKTTDQLAREVIRGLWGNGEERKRRLGNRYSAVQARVNEILGVGRSAPAPAAPAPSTPAPVIATPAPVISTPAPVQQAPVQESPPPPAIPPVPSYSKSATVQPVKYASPADVITDRDSLPEKLMLRLVLEKIGGIELISLVRHDTVNGQRVIYQPVKNLSELGIAYSPQNMIKIPDTSELYFKNFAIKLESHMLQDTNELPPIAAYIDPDGKVIINVFGLKRDYEVEVQMISSGQVFDDTIYEEDIS